MGTQTGILAEVPKHVRHLFFSLTRDAEAGDLLAELKSIADGEQVVAGIGQPLIDFTGGSIPGSIAAPVYSGSGVGIAALPYALWLWLRGDDPGELTRLTLAIEQRVAQHCSLEDMINGSCTTQAVTSQATWMVPKILKEKRRKAPLLLPPGIVKLLEAVLLRYRNGSTISTDSGVGPGKNRILRLAAVFLTTRKLTTLRHLHMSNALHRRPLIPRHLF